MIPLRDHNRTRTFPWVTYTILGVNVLVFLNILTLPEAALLQFVKTWALQPVEILAGQSFITLFTSMFLHGGVGHIVSNMLFLHIFGDNLEDALGHIRYILYYLVCGLGAAGLQIAITPQSSVPMLGASGAIAGLLGGYLLLFPNHRVDVLVPFGLLWSEATVPASAMLIYWFIGQFVTGLGTLGVGAIGGIAYFAHIGGFVTGLLLVWPLKDKSRQRHFQL